MKKLLIALITTLFLTGNVFAAVTVDVGAGFAYDHSRYDNDDMDSEYFLRNESIGFGTGCFVNFNKNFSLSCDFDFLFPVSEKIIVDGESSGAKNDFSFMFNMFVGPMFVLPVNETFMIHLGGGITTSMLYQYESYGDGYWGSTFIAPFGFAVKADATLKLSDLLGLNFAVTAGILGADTSESIVNDYSGSKTSHLDVNTHSFYVTPKISLLFHIGKN